MSIGSHDVYGADEIISPEKLSVREFSVEQLFQLMPSNTKHVLYIKSVQEKILMPRLMPLQFNTLRPTILQRHEEHY